MKKFTAYLKSLPVSTKRLLGLGLVAALVVALPLFIWGLLTQRLEIRERADVIRETILIDGEPSIGPDTAPVTIVEFGDLMCPFCKSFAQNTLPQILAAYPNDVKFVFKDLPVTGLHPLAEKAAIAAQCSFAQDKFWEMHDLIYLNQDTLTEASFATFSAQLNLDQTTFDSCYTNQIPLSEINQDIAEANALNIEATPTFFINGIKLEGAHPFTSFQSIIDAELLPSPSPTATSTTYPLDDVFFKNTGNSVTFTTTDQNPNVSVEPQNLVNGKTYILNVVYSLQNNIKSQDATSSAIPITVIVNNEFKSAKNIPYSLIAVHADGASDTQSASFVAQNDSTKVELQFDPNNIFPESNDQNNSLVFNFLGIGGIPITPTPSPTPTPYVEGEPNSCGGTCGSNYNCKAELYCHNGFCRNPFCPNDSACGCATATPIAKATNKPTKTPEIVYYQDTGGKTTIKPTARPTFKGFETPISGETTDQGRDWVFVGILSAIGASLIFTIWIFIRAFKKPNIPQI